MNQIELEQGIKEITINTENDHQKFINSSDLENQEKKSSPSFLYQFYPGNNAFYCNGKYIAGPKEELSTTICGWILLIITTIFYGILVAPFFWSNITKVIPLLTIFFFILTLFFAILTNCTDPGIIPRKIIFNIYGKYSNEFIIDNEESEEGKELIKKYKYCEVCKIFRPPKAAHCRFYLKNKY